MTAPLIRLATTADAAAIARLYAPYVRDTSISFETEPPDAAEIAARIDAGHGRYPWLVAAADGDDGDDGSVLGYAYASAHRSRAAYRWSVDVSVYLRPDVQRGGLGGRLYRVLLALLTAQGYGSAFAGITQPNPASTALHRSVGFAPVGVYRDVGFKFDRWYDVRWWQRELRGPVAAPAEPVAVSTLDADTLAHCLAR